jgi:hypothetical protein
MRSDESPNPLLAVACDRVLRRFGSGGELSGAVFNKVMTLLNRRLLESRVEQRLDIHLPHCWYLFGDEVVPRELPPGVRFEPAEAAVTRTTFRVNPELPRPEYGNTWQSSRISDEIRQIEGEFGNPVDLSSLVEEVYDGAPYPMQRAFLDLRRRLRFRDELWRLDNPIEGVLRPLFNEAASTFPGTEFHMLKQLHARYRRLGRFALDQGAPAVDNFNSITSEYWQAFCYFLRIDDRGHFNVSKGRIAYWRRVAPDYLASAGPRLNVYAEELVSTFASTIDPLDRAVLVGTDWGVRTSSDKGGEIDSATNS